MKYPSKGYDLVEGTPGKYLVFVNGKKELTSDMLGAVKFMVNKLLIKDTEVLAAISDMADLGADRAHFGAHGNFIGATNDPIGEVYSA